MADDPVYATHPEVVHYTDWAGLEGIVTSNSIRATRYDCLNDASEVTYVRETLIGAVTRHILENLRVRARSSFKVKREIDQFGGLIRAARGYASNWVGSVYRVSFQGNDGSVPFCIPYIASFCTHDKADAYVQKNGLLSQWRAYGGPQRFALVLDCHALFDALETESERFKYSFYQFCEAIYPEGRGVGDPRLSGIVKILCAGYDAMIAKSEDRSITEAIHTEFLQAVTRFKHRGFIEEREVRIVVSPWTRELERFLEDKEGGKEASQKKLKPILTRTARGKDIPYVALFGDTFSPLPIKKIIVKPCSDQSDATVRAEKLLGEKIEVWKSETPYIG